LTCAAVIAVGDCSPVTVWLHDSPGALAAAPYAAAVSLSADAGQFFSDTICSAAIQAATIALGNSSVGIYFSSTTPATTTLAASSIDFLPAPGAVVAVVAGDAGSAGDGGGASDAGRPGDGGGTNDAGRPGDGGPPSDGGVAADSGVAGDGGSGLASDAGGPADARFYSVGCDVVPGGELCLALAFLLIAQAQRLRRRL
jgi:hypothetical protein